LVYTYMYNLLLYMHVHKIATLVCAKVIFTLGYCFAACSVYKAALKDHTITNVSGGKTISLKKTNFPDTGKIAINVPLL